MSCLGSCNKGGPRIVAKSPKKEAEITDPQDDSDENFAEDYQPLVAKSVDKKHGEKLARWLKREMSRLRKHRS